MHAQKWHLAQWSVAPVTLRSGTLHNDQWHLSHSEVALGTLRVFCTPSWAQQDVISYIFCRTALSFSNFLLSSLLSSPFSSFVFFISVFITLFDFLLAPHHPPSHTPQRLPVQSTTCDRPRGLNSDSSANMFFTETEPTSLCGCEEQLRTYCRIIMRQMYSRQMAIARCTETSLWHERRNKSSSANMILFSSASVVDCRSEEIQQVQWLYNPAFVLRDLMNSWLEQSREGQFYVWRRGGGWGRENFTLLERSQDSPTRSSPYRAENTLILCYKNQSVNVV